MSDVFLLSISSRTRWCLMVEDKSYILLNNALPTKWMWFARVSFTLWFSRNQWESCNLLREITGSVNGGQWKKAQYIQTKRTEAQAQGITWRAVHSVHINLRAVHPASCCFNCNHNLYHYHYNIEMVYLVVTFFLWCDIHIFSLISWGFWPDFSGACMLSPHLRSHSKFLY